MKKIAINGFGRIGRLVFRQIFDSEEVEVVAINDLTTPETLSYLLQHDSAQGSWNKGKISVEGNYLIVSGKKIKIYAERNPEKLPWKSLGIDVVVESTGLFLTKEKANMHLKAGAKKVLLSAPTKDDIKTIVYGVNHEILDSEDKIVSGASCTTNCLAPMIHVLELNFGIIKGWMATIHSATNDQRVLDLPHHKDPRRGRSTLVNIIPTSTGAAIAVGKVIPHLNGKLDGVAYRVPTVTGSIVDLVVELKRNVTVDEVNKCYKNAQSDILGYTDIPIVSTDIIGETHGSIIDSKMTKIVESDGKQLIKVVSWYDNENSYVSQYVRTLKYLAHL